MRRTAMTLAFAAALGACGEQPDPTMPAPGDAALSRAAETGLDARATWTYEIEFTNLTDGQPLTPPLVATHRNAASLFTVGEAASFGLKEIAENGNLAPMLERLGSDDDVAATAVAVAGDPPPLMPGQSVTATIEASEGARFASFVAMLICTNDGFTGLDGIRLPARVGDEVVAHAGAYDAGTEVNTEDFADLVPPCPALTGVPSEDPGTGASDPALAENGVVHHHAGIQGIADLSVEVHGWSDPVTEIRIRRID
jgi:hypothetical protein